MNKDQIRLKLKRISITVRDYAVTFVMWLLLAALTGAVGGAVGGAFHISVNYATGVRVENPWIICFLPLAGLLIAAIYKLCRTDLDLGTNKVFSSVRTTEKVPAVMAPLIFVSTVLTHLFGGSAGREGAALQLGGSIGAQIGRLFHLDEKNMHLITICGMSGVFAALFGTPLTATFFALEVISVGVMYYSGFVPCVVSSLIGYKISLLMGVAPTRFALKSVPQISEISLLRVSALAALCALVSIVFCLVMKYSHIGAKKFLPNDWLRIAVGGVIIVGLSLIFRGGDYNGAGMNIITSAITDGSARPEAFVLKIIFTAVTIAAGYKGGEIVPTFFIGSTFGCIMGGLLGLDPGFGAAVGLIALFCGAVNSPVASMMLSIELFGGKGILFFAIAAGISYALSGYFSLYSSQKIVYSKLRAEYINRDAI